MQRKQLLQMMVCLFAFGAMGVTLGCGGVSEVLDSPRSPSPESPATESGTLPVSAPDAAQNVEGFTIDPTESTRAIGGRMGMQLILLPHWSTASVNNFLDVFKATNGKYTNGPQKVEISFAPYLYAPKTNYVNARRIIDTLTAAGKDVTVCVYLSYKNAGRGADTEIAVNTDDMNRNFLRGYLDKVSGVRVCPSLEDRGSKEDIDRWTNIIAAKIDGDKIGRVVFRRSPEMVTQRDGTYLPTQGRYRAMHIELHGVVNSSSMAADAYSNDGAFVYFPSANEDGNSMEPIPNVVPSPSTLANWGSSIRSRNFGGTVLIWRPAFNVFWRETRADGKRYYSRSKRNLSDPQICFDSVEQQVLKQLFNL